MEAFDERRSATVLFVDMCGYTALIGDEDPEDVARLLEQFKRIAGEVVEACGGLVNQFVGDEVVALFGVRRSYEDDACRAVTAALLLHERARSLGTLGRRKDRPCLLHTGIETGLVLARARDIRAGVYDLVGEPVNMAARLRAQAAPDEILLGPRTLALTAPFFVTEPCTPFVPRGMSCEVVPARVLSASSAQRPFDAALRRGLTDYVGRERELTRLVQVARTAEQGTGACVSVAGAPGMGKTRLFFEARKRLRSVLSRIPHVLVGRCAAYGRAEPYQPFIDALRKLLEELTEGEPTPQVESLLHYGAELRVHLPVLAYLLGTETELDPTPRELAGERLRDAIFEALAALLDTLARDNLVVLMLEDWHAADEASDAALQRLVARFAERRVLFVLNYRSTELAPERLPSSLHIELAPLDRERTAEVARALLQASRVHDDLSLFLHERTLGNPFFIEEVCRALAETHALRRRDDELQLGTPTAELQTPSSVQAMVRARVDRLAGADKELLRLASVLGSEFSLELLLVLARASLRLGGEAPEQLEARLRAQLEQLDDHGLVYAARGGEHPRYRFKHAITREVAYADLPREQRRAHHDLVGRAIEQRYAGALAPWYDVLAYHFAASHSTEKAVLFAELAADRAARAFSLEQAMNSYRVAIEGLDRSAESNPEKQRKRVALSLKWAGCCVFNPAREQLAVLEVSLRWARELGDVRTLVRCLCWLAWLAHTVGEQARAVAFYEQALASSDALHDDALLAQIRANIGLSYAMAARHDEAVLALSESVSQRKRVEQGGERDSAGGARGITPSLAGGGYGYTLAYLGMIAGERGDFAEGYALLAQAREIVEATGRKALIGAVLVLRAMVESWQGDWSACARTAVEARAVAERVNGGYLRAMSQTLGGAAQVLGEGELAGLASLRASVDWLSMRQIFLSMSWNEAWLAEALLSDARYEEAEQHARRALARAPAWDALGEAAAHRVLAEVHHARDHDGARARRELAAAHACAERKQSRRELLLCELALADLRAREGEHDVEPERTRCRRALEALGVRLR